MAGAPPTAPTVCDYDFTGARTHPYRVMRSSRTACCCNISL